MTDQRVQVVPYDRAWPQRFQQQAPEVTRLLGRWLAAPLEHIGSTAVPGLDAKPVVDMLAPVRSLELAQDALPVLADAGWRFWPEDPCRGYRLWLLYPRPEARTHHLHLIQADDNHAVALLAFRDALRGDEHLRDRYAALKRRLALEHPDNRNAYTNGKAPFVDEVLRAAGVAVPPRDPLPE